MRDNNEETDMRDGGLTKRLMSGAAVLLAVMCLPGRGGAETVTTQTIKGIVPDNIGEFLPISGQVAVVIPPPEPRAPYGFLLQDKAGDRMKVCVWPDIFARVDNRDLLQTTGSLVTMTAQVVEYKDKLELHVLDWEEIDVVPGAANDDATTAPLTPDAAVTTATTPPPAVQP